MVNIPILAGIWTCVQKSETKNVDKKKNMPIHGIDPRTLGIKDFDFARRGKHYVTEKV